MKIYTQKISGKYRSLKNYCNIALLLFYFLIPWIRWYRAEGEPNQAVIIDLPRRRGYFFDIEIWTEEIFYITAILIIAAFALFIVTSIFGRIWCGYTCPHTVFVDLFIKVETFFQGDRNSRVKIDQQPVTTDILLRKVSTYISWLVLSFLFAFGWVSYFYDAPSLVRDILEDKLGIGSKYWLLGLTMSTYLFAGVMRDKVCTYICPYGRFQSAMLDEDSLVVTYHNWRGEPRAKKSEAGKGDCIDCYKCVNVCPMGIDIRDGLQMRCIGCGLCIDACDSVMGAINRPLGLIAYDSINSTKALRQGVKLKLKIIRPKTILYSVAILTTTVIIARNLLNKPSFLISVERERSPLFTIVPSGNIRNTYYIYIKNKTLNKSRICIGLKGLESAQLKLSQGLGSNNYSEQACVTLDPDSEDDFKIFVETKTNVSKVFEQKIYFIAHDNLLKKQKTESVFIYNNQH
jgi:cytochrome c oxidase accessory protein FixG